MKLRTSISFWCLKMKIYPAGSVLVLAEGVIDLNKLQGDLFFSTRHFFSDFRLGAVKKHGCFCDLWFCFRCSSSTAGFMTLLADGITRAFNRVGDTQAIAHNISRDTNMRRYFCAHIDNLEQVLQIILGCLLPPLSIILHTKRSILFSTVFIK